MEKTQQIEQSQGQQPVSQELTLPELFELHKRHLGSFKALADKLGVSHTAISLTLRGKSPSKRIIKAARKYAIELLAKEERERQEEASDVDGESAPAAVERLRQQTGSTK